MRKKAFVVKVEINIKSITCPGVWLCTNGKVCLQIYMLDSCCQTDNTKPIFPIHCNEKYSFNKTFQDIHRLNDLQRALYNEWLYVELVQWQKCDEGCVLGTFQTTLDDLLYPTSIRGSVAGCDLELLMEPTSLFPGTIAPKLHINTKTTITEVLCNVPTDNSSVINPKLLISSQPTKKTNKARKVCHSLAFSRAKRQPLNKDKLKPPFVCRKVDDNLILRTNPNVVLKNDPLEQQIDSSKKSSVQVLWSKPCYCCCKRSRSTEGTSRSPVIRKPKLIYDHKKAQCSICSKYDLCFSDSSPTNIYGTKNPSSCPSEMSSTRNVCSCIAESATRESKRLARQLHRKFTDTFNYNSRLLRNSCINCDDC